jgi:multiple antibiotic resistance protein
MQTSLLLLMQAAIAVESPVTRPHYVFGTAEVFTFLFVMLGPLKLLGAFAQATARMPAAQMRALAVKATLIATVSVVLGGFIGASLMDKWKIDSFILEITIGLVLFLVALQLVMQQYEAPAPASTTAPNAPPSVMHIVFPMLLTPYGIAAVIVLVALSKDSERTLLILGVVLAMMLLNLLGMLLAHWIMRRVALPLGILGAVLAVLQVALALQLIFDGLRGLHVM